MAKHFGVFGELRGDLIAAGLREKVANCVHDHLVDVSVEEWDRLNARIVASKLKLEPIDGATEMLSDERLDIGRTYESLPRRVEKLITKAEDAGDDGFALAAMDGLRKVLKGIATMHGRMSTNLSVSVTLAESPE